MIKENDPMVYSSFKEKIKYFNPAFHSMTPEGLNARLTFLNQCLRPGDTIPVIGPDGKPVYNDATNTSFGTPPVLILRIGDFYHTKIIPNNLSFTYEPLIFDLNPEGIGVQPMIVDVSLSFNIIGGMGLKEPVDQLQNALSFNYYANTEIYDERATYTDLSFEALDKKVFDAIVANSGNGKNETVDNKQETNGGITIGEIKTETPVASGMTGEIIYGKVMDKLLDTTKDYFTNIPNQMDKVILQYNYGTLQLLNSKRDYTDGEINGTKYNEIIYGKPSINELTQKLFDNVIDSIKGGTANPIIAYILKELKMTGDENSITVVRQNMEQYIKSMISGYNSGLSTIIQEMVLQENSLITLIRNINLVSTGTDGKLKDALTPVVYNISGSTRAGDVNSASPNASNTFDELAYDYKSLPTALEDFEKLLKTGTNPLIDDKFDIDSDVPFTPLTKKIKSKDDLKFFMVMARVLSEKDKLESFKSFVISGNLTNPEFKKLRKAFDKICDELSSDYKKELDDEEKLITKFKKNKDYTKFTTGITDVMYPKGKTRRMDYTTVKNNSTQAKQEQDIKNIYGTTNYNNDLLTFDGKITI